MHQISMPMPPDETPEPLVTTPTPEPPMSMPDTPPPIEVEYVYALTPTKTFDPAQLPDNTWGHETPGTSNGLIWSNKVLTPSAALPVLWFSY